MKFNPEIHHRRSIRLKGYDYSQKGAYFVTICTQNRECLFGNIYDGKISLNGAGEMVRMVWNELPIYYNGINIDEFQIMPNHFHGIIVIIHTMSLSDAIHRFKTMSTKQYVDGVKQNGWQRFPGKFWQRNYYEHIIRDENELNRIREYIMTNPLNWNSDKYNPMQNNLIVFD